MLSSQMAIIHHFVTFTFVTHISFLRIFSSLLLCVIYFFVLCRNLRARLTRILKYHLQKVFRVFYLPKHPTEQLVNPVQNYRDIRTM